MSAAEKPRQTGIPRKTLDRSKVYRIWHTGRRWEVLDIEGEPEAAGGPTDGRTGADGGAASTVRAPWAPGAPDAPRGESP